MGKFPFNQIYKEDKPKISCISIILSISRIHRKFLIYQINFRTCQFCDGKIKNSTINNQ